MEDAKEACGNAKTNDENPSSAVAVEAEADVGTGTNLPAPPQASRTPFTNLSQVDADLALARTLQEQERAYMMLRMNGEVSDYGSSDAGSYADEDEVDDLNEDENAGTDAEEDAFDVHPHADAADDDDQGNEFDSDEAFARALQDAEEREMAVHLMALAGINDWEAEDTEDHGSNSQDTWEEVDPDELSYEELLALGEVVGTESRGLSAETIASLPSINYKAQSSQDGSTDQCVICRLDYEDGDALTVLSCKHSYHSECINNWLQINKVCPVCSAEVSISGSR
ncbi:E3 ubiquitin ligase BIG BROTHER-related-like [Telopea speciosissima]|uniref:E3 ubiquitin ligase BIG BROTHER-related-like n=1 Tax=Telopea speciosissima TaxID=54955 RepID=UPI001CC59629|nr:E3 ubiquitin ligase BIG BROTHER-related-like [Telopea speciosissima]